MEFHQLYKSVFAIFRIEGGQGKVAGTGFLISKNPFYILTCNHVVSEATEDNNGNIVYSITKRTDANDVFDIRQAQITLLRANRIVLRPENDLAILEIDPTVGQVEFDKLDIANSNALELAFETVERHPGIDIEWLSTGAIGDLTLTPRFFQGNLIATYITNHSYGFKNNQGQDIQQVMNGVNMLEVDKLFIPGCSGSPILNKESNHVIGFVHGYRTWPFPTNSEVSHQVELTENGAARNVDLKYQAPLIASLSLGIDVRSIETYLKENHFIS